MTNININLLPKEVLEKRKAEKVFSLAVYGILGLVAICVVAMVVVVKMVDGEKVKVDELKAENARYELAIAQIANFEVSKIQVEERAGLVEAAIARKYSFSKLLNNLSLIIPNEVWVTDLSVAKGGMLDIAGAAVADADSKTLGQKSVAKWLVRLTEIDDIGEVWLGSSTKSEGAPREPLSGAALDDQLETVRDEMGFSIKAKVLPLDEDSPGSAPPGGKT